MEAETQRVERRLQEWTAQAARNKDAREAKSEHRRRSAKRRCGWRPSTRAAEAALDALQAELATLRQKRETLQQEAAQVTAELAGLEERRRGAEAAFQRIDRLHGDLERRVLTLSSSERRPSGARAAYRESAELAQRENELTALRAEALALAQTLFPGAGPARATGGHGGAVEDRPGRARPVAREPRRPLQRSGQAALRLEHLEASCLAEVNVEAAVLRADEPIARLTATNLPPKKKPAAACACASSRWAQ